MTQAEARKMIEVLKKLLQNGTIAIPAMGSTASFDLRSVLSENDRFAIVFNRRSKISSDKYTLLLRYIGDEGLLRIDVGGPNHVNPDGTIVPCPHIHVRRKDTGAWDAWATDVPSFFDNVTDRVETFGKFLQYCNVNDIADIEIVEQQEMGAM